MTNYETTLQPKGFPNLPAGWTSEAELFTMQDGTKLYGALHHKGNYPRVLFTMHGQGEHGGRYLHYAHYLQQDIDGVFTFDLRGHGRSEGRRGHTDYFDVYADDAAVIVRALTERLRKQYGNYELHLFGHSMGGLVALRLLLKHPELKFTSATVSAPLLGLRLKVPKWKDIPAKGLAKLWPTMTLPSGIAIDGLGRDQNVLEAYREDTLVHDKVSAAWYVGLHSTIKDTLSRNSGIKPPIMFVIPLKDPIVDPGPSIEFFNQLHHQKKTLVTLPDFLHESFNEIEKEKAFRHLATWLSEHHEK